jgi:ferredoxin--NADP+ reductase
MLGRRGPAQAAFTNAEIRELGELAGADVVVLPDEVKLDPESRADVDQSEDRSLSKKVEILEEFARRPPPNKARTLVIRFLVSPLELLGDERGHVRAMRVSRSRLERGADGTLRAVPTGEVEEWPVDVVFRSVGYRGVPLDGLPFNERSGTVPNDAGRVLRDGVPLRGIYVAGWIKRGPTGVIGTNKPDAGETVDSMLADLEAHHYLDVPEADAARVTRLVERRQPLCITYHDWRRLDALEVQAGKPRGRPRVKFTSVEAMLSALGHAGPA